MLTPVRDGKRVAVSSVSIAFWQAPIIPTLVHQGLASAMFLLLVAHPVRPGAFCRKCWRRRMTYPAQASDITRGVPSTQIWR